MSDDTALRQNLSRMEQLIHEVEKLEDPALRQQVQELVQHLLDFHGAALTAMVGQVSRLGDSGRSLVQSWAADELVANLLLLYGLHPVDLEMRVEAALESARPYLRSHGGNVELLGIEDGVVHLRLEGHCKGCPSSTVTLRLTIERAIYDAAPDVVGIEVEGAVPPEETPTPRPATVPMPSFLPLEQLKVAT